jgi:hypothetical protein
MGGKRICTKCQEDKLLTEFRKDSSRPLGHSYICKPCNVRKDAVRYASDIMGQRKRGLHVPWNLTIITAFENLSKGNKFPVEYQNLAWGV